MDIRIRRYVELTLMRGVNLQKGQILVIDTPLWTAEFCHLLMEEAYRMGAADVIIHYDDPEGERIRINMAPEESLTDVPRWMVERSTVYGDREAAFLRVISPKPAQGPTDARRSGIRQRALKDPLRPLQMKRMANDLSWSAVAVPNPQWAGQVFPDLPQEEAVSALWEQVFACCYVTRESGVDGWDRHISEMLVRVDRLNALQVRSLHFQNGKGTDLVLRMCEEGVFAGGICHCPEPDGLLFAPNIPTEEILTTPHRFSAEGIVYNTLPLVYNGQIIDEFCLTFREGQVAKVKCGKGEDLLRSILETDEGSCRLGEVALVPYDSPIRKSGVLFYNTLFDENASCHLALGMGYLDVLHGRDRRTEALVAQGLNVSSLHVDFMFGSADMCCTAETSSGEQVVIFKDGVFQI